MINNTYNDFERIVTQEIPLIDVRAPIEFEKGAFINAINLPLMNNEERHLVGICYKEKGNEEAVKLGQQLVSGEVRQARIDAWTKHLEKHPNSMIYCFRGGLRSRISQEWIFEAAGKQIARLEGGYKALRNYLITAFESSEQMSMPILLGGYTGSGKTRLLKKLENAIDLEGLAHHRGSSFGKYVMPQPTQINYENNLAYALIQHRHKHYRYMILEDESLNIGRCFTPKPLFEYFKRGKIVLLDVPFEQRVDITMNEYVVQSQADYIKAFGEQQGRLEWYKYISRSISKLKKRLGGSRCKCVMHLFELAYQDQVASGNYDKHKEWIGKLLKEYYDPMYHYQLQKDAEKILFRGSAQEVLAYLKTYRRV